MKKLFGASRARCCLLSAPAAASAAVEIDVLSNRADLISAGDALVEIKLPAGTDPSERRRHRRRPRRVERVRGERRRPLPRPRRRPRPRRQRAHGDAARRLRRAHHDREPPERRPGLLRPAGPAVGVPGDRGRRAVQPAGRVRVPVQERERPVRRLRPGEPALGRRDDDDRPGQRGAVHRPHRDRLPGARPVQDRGPLRPVEAVHRGKPPGRLQPQAADHPRRELRDRPPGGLGARRDERHRALARVRGHVDGAQQRRPQLQPRHPGRVDGDGEGAARRAVRRAALHDRHRLLGRLAHPAAGRERLPRPLPGDPAGVLVPRRVVDRPAARGLQPAAALPRGPDQVGARRRVGAGLDRRGRGPSQPRQLDRLRHGLLDLARRAGRRLPGRPGRAELQRRDEPRRASAARSRTT